MAVKDNSLFKQVNLFRCAIRILTPKSVEPESKKKLDYSNNINVTQYVSGIF